MYFVVGKVICFGVRGKGIEFFVLELMVKYCIVELKMLLG